MKRLFLSLLLSVLAGCSSVPVNQDAFAKNPTESEDFGVYVRLFQNEAYSHGLVLSLPTLDRSLRVYKVDEFNEDLQKAHVIGLCIKTAGEISIYIDRSTWNDYDSQQREMLLFHELGHCILNLDHDKTMDSAGVPSDLLYPVSFDSLYYYKYREHYLSRLFQKALNNLKDPKPVAEETISTCRWGLKYNHGKIIDAATGKTQRSVGLDKTVQFRQNPKN